MARDEVEKLKEEVKMAIDRMEEVIEKAREVLKKFGEEISEVLTKKNIQGVIDINIGLETYKDLIITVAPDSFIMKVRVYKEYEDEFYDFLLLNVYKGEKKNYIDVQLKGLSNAMLLIENFEDILSAITEELREHNERYKQLIEKANKILKALNSCD